MKRLPAIIAAVLIVVGSLALATPGAIRAYWHWRASNPVRRGLAVAEKAGCFSCHGPLGSGGLADPGPYGGNVPAWTNGEWTAFLDDAPGVREYVLRGSALRRETPAAAKPSRAKGVIEMPAYAGRLTERQIEDVVAAFTVVSGMSRPPEGSKAAEGYAFAAVRGCFSCHGPGGSGGRPNPGAYTGTVPGWYGAEFRDLVADRGEFDRWIREGRNARVEASAIGGAFLRRQALKMPGYRGVSDDDLDALWAYVAWLGDTRGGVDAATGDGNRNSR